MPPKRKRAADLANESKPAEEESPPKKQKLMDTKQSGSQGVLNGSNAKNNVKNSAKTDPESDKGENDANSSSEEDESKPVCWYDENCYRQNPAHFVQFRHPKKTALEKQKKKDESASSSQAIVGKCFLRTNI